MNSTPNPSCPSCGQPIPAGAPEGLCPRCLMLGAADPPPPPGATHLPTREEIAHGFPALVIGEMIGHGGMGAVFRARQPKLERDVALKVLPRALAADPSFAERFHREARALAKLNHPNIVTVHDYGEQGGWYYLLMELVDGVNLRQAMRTKRFTPEQALQIVPQICSALEYAHREGVLHRDIKPENLLLDAKGKVKIADFGIAKLGHLEGEDVTLTVSGARLGTMAYMAPEQIEQPGRVDHRADIYSLGVVFYEMLTGELPIGRFAAPSEKSPVGAQVDEVVFRTLEKSPDRRFQSAGEMQTKVETLSGRAGGGGGRGGGEGPPPLPPAPPPAPPPPMHGGTPGRFTGPAVALGLLIAAAVAALGLSLGLRFLRGQPSSMTYVEAQARWNSLQPLLVVAGTVIGGLALAGIVLGWINLIRLRLAAAPRRGLVVALIVAMVPFFVLLWMVIAINIRDEPLAWLDGIVLTGLLLVWAACWMNPLPRPWSIQALLAFSLVVLPVLLIAHAWRSHGDSLDSRWAQEMNLLQIQINDVQNRSPAGTIEARIQGLESELERVRMGGAPSGRVPYSSNERLFFALAACCALGGTLLGWVARRELRRAPGMLRGRVLAECASWLWPVVVGPVLLLFMA